MFISASIMLDWKIFVMGFSLLAAAFIINTKITILPVGWITFVICCILSWFLALCVTFVGLHKLLQRNEPLSFRIGKFSIGQTKIQKQKSILKPNPEKVKKLTEDIDKYFISKWYVNISRDEHFTEESKQFLEDVISRLAEVQLAVNNKVLLHGFLNIYLKHLKEFRRSLKRKEKYEVKIEELYRYSHISSTSSKPVDYFLHQLTTNLLRHFINSELWNSLPCHILVSILARKLVSYALKLASNPEILNYYILTLIASSSIKEKYNLSEYSRVCISQYYDVIDSKAKPVEKDLEPAEALSDKEESTEVTKSVNDTQKEEKKDEHKPLQELLSSKENLLTVESVEKKRKTFMKKVDVGEELKEELLPEKRVVSDPVKIYEPKVSKHTRTWTDSKDLTLGISLGHDPLDSLHVTETTKIVGKSTFWETAKLDYDFDGSPPNAANILFNEMKHTTQTTMEGLKSSIKPISDATVNTLHNIKDLQESTVNNALHKIGDFQDEAAGMVEGILDFGRAGFRKGLRLTGLQDNIENAKATLHISPKQQPKKKATKLTRSESPEKLSSEDSMESVWMNPIQMDSPNYDGHILLEKERPKKIDEKEKKTKEDIQIPSISMEQPEVGTDSPDPEYEDAADLATSIAKLRSLLQQRSSESSMSTPALSPMPTDDLSQRMMEAESVSDIEEVDGVMPSFYKFCAKTATGVFDKTINTIKTALPGGIQGLEQSDNAWIFIQSDQNEVDIVTRMKKLLTERKEYCTLDTEIDNAYEAIDSLDGFKDGSKTFPILMEFEDELDDFEAKLPVTKTLVDIMCELLADTNSPFLQEPFIKGVLLSVGNSTENFVISKVDSIMENLCTNLLTIPEISNQNTLFMELDVYIEALLSSLPDVVKLIFGKTTLTKALTLLVSSLQVQKINQDVVLQIFELISMKLIEESTQLSPPASA